VLPPNTPFRSKDFLATLFPTCWAWVGSLTILGTLLIIIPGDTLIKLELLVLLSLCATTGYAVYSFRKEFVFKK